MLAGTQTLNLNVPLGSRSNGRIREHRRAGFAIQSGQTKGVEASKEIGNGLRNDAGRIGGNVVPSLSTTVAEYRC